MASHGRYCRNGKTRSWQSKKKCIAASTPHLTSWSEGRWMSLNGSLLLKSRDPNIVSSVPPLSSLYFNPPRCTKQYQTQVLFDGSSRLLYVSYYSTFLYLLRSPRYCTSMLRSSLRGCGQGQLSKADRRDQLVSIRSIMLTTLRAPEALQISSI